MARTTSSALSTASAARQASVPSFSQQSWAKLADHLVSQDLVLLPTQTNALGHEDGDNKEEIAHRHASGLALISHWESLGFALSKNDILRICEEDPTAHAWLHKTITPALKKRVGAHVSMKPMYPNFPKQVMEMSEAALLHNALLHYQGDELGIRILPHTDEKPRKALRKRETKKRALRVIDQSGLQNELYTLAHMNTVWTPAQVELATLALPLMLGWQIVGEKTALPQRENQARVVGAWLGLVRDGQASGAWPAERVSTTDILRAAVAYSGGDPSLSSSSEKTRFAKLSRPQRRVIMQALERAVKETSNPLTDLHAQRQSWLRLAENLHVGEWKKMPAAVSAVNDLRNNPEPISWNGTLDAVLSQKADSASVSKATAMFAENPGYAARAISRIQAWSGAHAQQVIDAFEGVADRVDTPVLLSVSAACRANAAKPGRERVMLPKGMAAKRYRVQAKRAPLNAQTNEAMAKVCDQALMARFSQLEPLGKVFVEPGLNDVIVPKGLRSASESVGVVSRGSWLPVGQDAKTVRLFLWWKDTDTGRVDVDLSAVGVDKDFHNTETCNYHSMKEAGMTHSGDLTSAPGGAAEFIDINMNKLSKETRYVVLAANVFHGPGFSQLPECFVGWQERESGGGQRGDIMEVKTVVDKFQVTASTKGFLGVVFDVKMRRLMWLDMPMNSRHGFSIYDSMDKVTSAVEDMQLHAFSQAKIGHLINLHIEARGGVEVEEAKDADVVFSLTPRVAKNDQIVIAATQPQAVATALLAGPVREPKAEKVKKAEIEAKENELDGLQSSIQARAKAGRVR